MIRFILMAVLAAGLSTGCGKKTAKNNGQPDSSPPDTPAPANTSSGGGGPAIVPGGGIGVVVNPSAALGGGGGGGAVQQVRKAARRTQALNEMNTLGQVISMMQNDLGRMPAREQIMAELKQYPTVLQAINEGAFILTGTTEAGGLWAYEVDADTKPGIALIGGRATRSTPDDLRPYFAAMPKPPTAPAPAPPQPAAPPGRPGSSSSSAPAANVTVSKQDMEDIRTFVDNASGASGQMPSPQLIYTALVQSGSPAAKLVEARAIILTGAQVRESVWAYEVKAATQGGMIVTQNGVETVTAAEVKRRVGLR
jgi:hypothetical protein